MLADVLLLFFLESNMPKSRGNKIKSTMSLAQKKGMKPQKPKAKKPQKPRSQEAPSIISFPPSFLPCSLSPLSLSPLLPHCLLAKPYTVCIHYTYVYIHTYIHTYITQHNIT